MCLQLAGLRLTYEIAEGLHDFQTAVVFKDVWLLKSKFEKGKGIVVENFIQSIRDNGIQMITAQQQNLHSVCIGFYFKAGILYETEKTNGISHLIEHLFYRKMADLLQEELYYKMESIGSTLRAKTYINFIGYDIIVVPQHFREAFDIIVKLLQPFSWKESDIDSEKAVVLKQIDFKSTSFEEEIDSSYFRGTRLHKPIMGKPENVKKFSNQTIQKFKNMIFNSKNAYCAITGNYNDEDYQYVIDKLDKVPEGQSASLISRSQIPSYFCKRTALSDKIIDTDWELSDVAISFDIDRNRVNECAVDLLCSILGEGDGSKLSLVLREKFALTDEIYSRVDIYPEIERLTIEFSTENSNLEQSLKLIFDEIIKLKNRINRKDLLGSITFFTDNQYQLLDSPRDLNFLLAWRHIAFGQELSGIDQLVEEYKSITVDALLLSANEIFTSNNLIVAVTNNTDIYKKAKLKALLIQLREMLG